MHTKDIVSETPLTMAEVKEDLSKIKEDELNIRVNKTVEYLNQFAKLSYKDSKTLVEKLTKLDVPRLKEKHICKIVDILPASMEELKSLLQAYTITINNDNLKKILDTVKEFVKKK
ncbi:MAG: RNA polymerase Rpb4 family protein [Candidatus Woesearchaeota archaeon]|jgi:DNA-directed RNA polymerase subunit F|nr:RNA polymerase Rpb4 family protein [Candidatus Woesearchaeota archaeon]|tara:strand:- start:2576 stop:2923 length:348 start_codon:yes stop_codon:yes gene_type:complete